MACRRSDRKCPEIYFEKIKKVKKKEETNEKDDNMGHKTAKKTKNKMRISGSFQFTCC